jgi:hypothetical protein
MITVYYTDGTRATYPKVSDAEDGIFETVIGCDFATTVESVEDEKGNELFVEWRVILRRPILIK